MLTIGRTQKGSKSGEPVKRAGGKHNNYVLHITLQLIRCTIPYDIHTHTHTHTPPHTHTHTPIRFCREWIRKIKR